MPNGLSGNDAGGLSPLQRLRMQLSAIRSEQSGDGWDGTPLGGNLRGPWQSDGYAGSRRAWERRRRPKCNV